ncbi:MAG TPA: hypothetical protein PKC76_09035 [Saprospiraceae bacterium]|nr:hypothetical protein [Saprospiraceae bacterium]HMP24263.1 hypothetical protein [Saprospiraceae bacterium]
MQIINARWVVAIWIVLLGSWTSGCSSSDPTTQNTAAPAFFDLKQYFQAEIKRLEAAKLTIVKKVAVNDQTEEKTNLSPDFSKELDAFIQADINRKDWLDRYQIDSTRQNGQLTALRYQALDDRLRTRQLDIAFEKGEVQSIRILRSNSSMVVRSDQELIYQPSQGYRISSRQGTPLSNDKRLELEVRFQN